MDAMSIIGLVTGIIGTATGLSGLTLSILNYWRDRPNIQINLLWDMESFGDITKIYDTNKLWGVVSITNIGRRPIFFSHVHLKISGQTEILIINEGLDGEKLQEGDPPKYYPINQEGLDAFAKQWKNALLL